MMKFVYDIFNLPRLLRLRLAMTVCQVRLPHRGLAMTVIQPRLLRRKLLAMTILLFITGCGFEPLYVEKKNSSLWYFGGEFDTSISQEMTQVKVESIEGRFGQQIRNILIDSLTPKGIPSKPKYRLYTSIEDKTVELQALREDITATREKVTYIVNYRMVDGDTELFKGNSVAYVSYDVLANPYSTTMSSKKAEADAAKIIADDIALRVGAYFHSINASKGTVQ